MPIHLHQMLVENSQLMGQVIDDIPSLLKRCRTPLGSSRGVNEDRDPPLKVGELYYTVEKIKMLIKIVVLKELGFGQEAVRAFVEKKKLLGHLKSV